MAAAAAVTVWWGSASAQGTITPVDTDTEKPPQPIWHYYDRHGEKLEKPVLFLAELDTVTKVRSKPVFPAYNGVMAGVNFFDALMKIGGQTYSSFDVSADVSLFNWFFPTVEAGIGFSSSSPENGAFRFKAKPSPYVKLGFDYNFLYKSNPDYQFRLGTRAGMAHTRWEMWDIGPGCDWYIKDGPTEYRDLTTTSWYWEVLAGLRVKIWGPVSMGWTIRYHTFISKARSGVWLRPWFVPGYGVSPLGGTFSVFVTLGRKRSEPLRPGIDDALPDVQDVTVPPIAGGASATSD